MVSTTPRRDQHGEAYLPNTALSTHDMAQLALCCTGLESLTVVVDTVHHDNGEGGDIDRREQPCSLLPLQQLSCLTALGLQQAGAGLGQTTGWLHSHLLELSGCTGLQSLVLCGRSCLITDSSVQALTQLTALTQLHMDISPDAPVSDTVAPGKGSSERQLSLCLFDCLWDVSTEAIGAGGRFLCRGSFLRPAHILPQDAANAE